MEIKRIRLVCLLKDVPVKEVIGSKYVEICKICNDSRQVVAESLFVAIKGTNTDGHIYIKDAIEKGCSVVVCSRLPDKRCDGVTYVLVENSVLALAYIAKIFYGNPSSKLKLVAVTGTSGKTTTVHLLYHIFQKFGHKVGLFSTIYNKVDNRIIETNLTTPDVIIINQVLAEMVKFGCEYCFIEASSHAIDQHRLAGLTFAGAVFLNISHDHLDYHVTFAKYIETKKKIFDHLSFNSFALVNADDKNGSIMLQNTKAKKATFSLRSNSDFHGKVISNTIDGLEISIENFNVWLPLVGEYNAYNVLAAYGVSRLFGKDGGMVLLHLSTVFPISGRFECMYSKSGFVVIVDYAHKPDALSNLLETIRKTKNYNARIILVVGCGGNRDVTKRPIMAEIACRLSDFVVFTSDNPRFESSEEIIEQMKSGVNEAEKRKRFISILDREEAIKAACVFALPGDIVVVAGKGHEKYQEVNGVKYPFDDREIVRKWVEICD